MQQYEVFLIVFYISSMIIIYIVYFFICVAGPSWPWSYDSWIYNSLCIRYLSPLMLWVRLPLRASSTTLCDKFCRWLAAGWWLSPGTRSSTNKTDCHDITDILLKVALNTIKQTSKHICVALKFKMTAITVHSLS